MSTLRGITVYVATGSSWRAGPDDALYVGVCGTAGGREFPLDVPFFDDFQRGSRERYALGTVWDESALIGVRTPKKAVADWNDPAYFYVGFQQIDRVYLRKQIGKGRMDDAYALDEIEIALYGEPGEKRLFRASTAIWLGVEYGGQVWLPEVDPDSFSVAKRV